MALAVSIAMALSITKLKDDQILVQRLGAIQTCAMLHDVCIAKSGTITKSEMSVNAYHSMDKPQEVVPCGKEVNSNFFKDEDYLTTAVREMIIGGSNAWLDINIDADNLIDPKKPQLGYIKGSNGAPYYEPKGSDLEKSLL